ncbi:MAG: maltose alpha-D-glucosyltransferase [Polyangia bacterium]
MTRISNGMPNEPLWYKDAVFYELRVRSFYDSNADGVGDFPGLTAKLPYLQDLGINTLWLLPFYPSPMRDDGYDTADYTDVHPDCGTLDDFKAFLAEAHRRGLRVVTELVCNHTSDQHPWFQRARRAPIGSPERDFYVWSDTADKYKDARIIFTDTEPSNWSWDPVAKQNYWHRFFSHQPDLNFENPAVQKALFDVVDFWFNLGVDGLRLDAVPYLFEEEGSNCENLPRTHQFLKDLRKHVDDEFADRMLLAEANQWPEDAVAYLGDECHMAFHFPLMPRLFLAVRMEDRFPITDVWAQTPAIDPDNQWALFLRNHDELTLEMVTDEERDYMYRAYASEGRMRINVGIRRRLAPLLGNNRRTIELKYGLLLSLPGTPVLYYGDEIGMGDNVYLGDRDGVRTPMQWSGDRNAGFSTANPQKLILPVVIDLEYHYQTVNVESQEQNHSSLLWWMRRLVALRKQYQAFGRGTMEFLNPDNSKIVAYVRVFNDEKIVVVANLSRFPQATELDLSRYAGMLPIELSGRSPFPVIGTTPYPISLGAHGFYWFSIEPAQAKHAVATVAEHPLVTLSVKAPLAELLRSAERERLEAILPDFLSRARWFGGKARSIKRVRLLEPVPIGKDGAVLTFVEVDYHDGDPDQWVMPLAYLEGEDAAQARQRTPDRAICELEIAGDPPRKGLLFDAVADPAFDAELLFVMEGGQRLRGEHMTIVGQTGPLYGQVKGPDLVEARLLKGEQSNSSIIYSSRPLEGSGQQSTDRMVLKLFRRVDEGVSPELEIGRYLSETGRLPDVATTVGWIEAVRRVGEPRTLAVLQRFVPNQGDAWRYTRDELQRYYERAAASKEQLQPATGTFTEQLVLVPPQGVRDLVGAYLDAARLMGQRTAELHRAMVGDAEHPAFLPEAYSTLYQRSQYQSFRNLSGDVLRTLVKRLSTMTPATKEASQALLAAHDRVSGAFEDFMRRKLTVLRTRCHGDLHLGQMLYTGKDFVIVDFEGEPARTLVDRRRRRSALRDVAGMLRSFHYAAFSALLDAQKVGTVADLASSVRFAEVWQSWTCQQFLKGYVDHAAGTLFMPQTGEELDTLTRTFLLEKALYELNYELNNRPDWVGIPLHGIGQLLGIDGLDVAFHAATAAPGTTTSRPPRGGPPPPAHDPDGKDKDTDPK